MSLAGYSDLDTWVRVVSDKMADVLSKRLQMALKGWNKALRVVKETQPKENGYDENEQGVSVRREEEEVEPAKIDFKVVLEIVLRNQEISAVPSMPTVRALFLSALHSYVGVVCNLPKPKGGRYEVSTASQPSELTNRVNLQILLTI